MSQQNPGQPGGYGGTPPGYGGPYGAPPIPPTGGMPPGANPYPVIPQPPTPPASSNRKSQVWLGVGLGCGLLLLVAIGGIVGVLFWLRNRGNALVEDVQRQMASSSAVSVLAATSPLAGTGAELSGDCKVAYSCCKVVAAKSTDNKAAAVQSCEVFKAAGYSQASCASSLAGYRQVAKAIGVACE